MGNSTSTVRKDVQEDVQEEPQKNTPKDTREDVREAVREAVRKDVREDVRDELLEDVREDVREDVQLKRAAELEPGARAGLLYSTVRGATQARQRYFVDELNREILDFVGRYAMLERKQVLQAKLRVIEKYERLLHALARDVRHVLERGQMEQHGRVLEDRAQVLFAYDPVIEVLRTL